jgi:type IV pilus assembly protein PilN
MGRRRLRIPINLASEPFRNDRPVLAASLGGSIALGVLLVVLVSSIISARSRAANLRDTVDRLSRQVQVLSNRQAELDSALRQAGNAEVLDRSVLLNTLIERKSISWTRIFADLDKVLPYNVRLIYIRLPQITSQNRVTLDMVVGAQSPEPVFEFLRRVEASPLFGPAEVPVFMPPAQNEPLYRYRVSVSYAQKL